jgi:hypothetical protein
MADSGALSYQRRLHLDIFIGLAAKVWKLHQPFFSSRNERLCFDKKRLLRFFQNVAPIKFPKTLNTTNIEPLTLLFISELKSTLDDLRALLR